MRKLFTSLLLICALSALVIPQSLVNGPASVRGQGVVRRAAAGGCTAFPCTSILDNFDRADSGSLGASWTEPMISDSGWLISDNTAAGGVGTASAYWNAGNFGPGVEIHSTLLSSGDGRIYWRVTSEGSGSANGYFIYHSGNSIYIYRTDAGSLTQIGSTISQTITAGDSWGAYHSAANLITVYYCLSGAGCGVSGAGWTSVGSVSDSTYTSAGKIGIYGSNAALDDFGGGTR